MAITTSRGYPGLVTASDYAILSRHQGQSYAVLKHDHLVVSKGTGDRGVKISGGTGLGHGVMDVNVGDVNLNATVMNSAGSRWDTVALERDWVTKTSSFVILTGNSTKAVSAARLRNAGTGKDHQPLWLIRVENGKTDIQDFVDIRVWQQDGGLYAADPIARDYMDELGTDMFCKNGIRYIRVLDPASGLPVWSEHRKAAFGERPYAYIARNSVIPLWGPGVDRLSGASLIARAGGSEAHLAVDGAGMTVLTAGLYAVHGQARLNDDSPYYAELYFGSRGQAPVGGLPGAPGSSDSSVHGAEAGPHGGYTSLCVDDLRFLAAGSRISLSLYANNILRQVETWQLWATRVSD